MTIKPNRDDTKTLGDALLRRNGYGTTERRTRLDWVMTHFWLVWGVTMAVLIGFCIIWGRFA